MSLNVGALPPAQALPEASLWNHSSGGQKGCGLKRSSAFIAQWVCHLPQVTNFHKNSVPGRVLIPLKKGGCFSLGTKENSIGVCGFLFALDARKLRVKFTANLSSL